MSSLPHSLSALTQSDQDKITSARFDHRKEVLSRIHKAHKLVDCLLVPYRGILEVVAQQATTDREQELINDMAAIAWDAWIGLGSEVFRLVIGGVVVHELELDILSNL